MCIKIKTIYTNDGGEFQRGELIAEWDREDINVKFNITFSRHQNGVAESISGYRHLYNIYILNDVNLPVIF